MMKMSASSERQNKMSGGSSTPAGIARADILEFGQTGTVEEAETHRLWARRVVLFHASIGAILVLLIAGNQINPRQRDVSRSIMRLGVLRWNCAMA